MTIPESQLQTWSNQGAITTAKATHEQIRRALTAAGSPVTGKDFDIYLQGSYRNTTNIRGDSDVDVIVQLNSTFEYDLLSLPDTQQRSFQESFVNATYTWWNFRQDVLTALTSYYGSTAVDSTGNNSLKIAAAPGRLTADVVPCLEYRWYRHFFSTNAQDYINGIVFYTQRERDKVINFPKQHIANGFTKNDATHTNEWYKPTVRMFKNARSYLVNQGRLSQSAAPSYFVECLLYNVPDMYFNTNFQITFCNVLTWLIQANTQGFICQNGLIPLFGNTRQQWSIKSAHELIVALVQLWTEW